MRKELVTARARIRSRATLETHATALKALRDIDASSPAVPAANPSQALLEGLLFQSIGTLHFPWRDGPYVSWGEFLEVTRLQPEPDRLVIDVDPNGAAITIANGALAHVLTRWIPDEVYAPLLRPRATTEGVEFHRLGNPGAVLFRGISLSDLITADARRYDRADPSTAHTAAPSAGASLSNAEDDTAADTTDDVDLVWKTSPTIATTAELQHVSLPRVIDRQSSLWVTSSVIRRLGILIRLGSTSINTWRDTYDGTSTVKVEAWYPHLTPATRDRLLKDLASPHLSPRWAYQPPPRTPHGDLEEMYHFFTVADTRHQVRLRLPIEHRRLPSS